MSSDIQAQVTANTGPAVTAIDQIRAAMDRLIQKFRTATTVSQDMQKKISGGFKEGSAGVARAGGALGSIGGRVLGGVGMGGPIGIASAGLAVLTAGITALSAASARAVKAVEAQIDVENKFQDARDKGEKALEDSAKKGADQAPKLRQVIAQGGPAADSAIRKLETRGVDTESAAKGLQAIIARFPGQDLNSGAPAEILAQAEGLAKVGMKFDDAVGKLIERGGMGNPASAYRQASLIYKEFTGSRGDPMDLYHKAQVNVSGSKFLTDEEAARKKLGQLPGIQRDQSGDLLKNAMDTVGEAMKPTNKLLLDAYNLQEKQLEQMQRAADAQWWLARILTTAGRTYGLSEGSEKQKVDSARIALAAGAGITVGTLVKTDR